MTRKNLSCAVVMSGHARMVPQGMHLLRDRFSVCKQPIDYTVFSNVWTDASETRSMPVSDQLLHDQILADLGTRHRVRDQQPEFEQLRQRFLRAGAIPDHEADGRGFRMPRETFYRFMGQVIGFCWAVIYWRRELSQYDYIVRSRWDMCLDTEVLNFLSEPPQRYLGEFDSFYTKSVEIVQGHIQISGDTIYGHTAQWLNAVQSMDTVIDRIIEGTRLRWIDIQARYSARWNSHGDYEKYYLTGWWFNSHFIWTALFSHTNISIRPAGESFGLSPDLATIPLDELNYCHVAGQVYRLPEEVKLIVYSEQKLRQEAHSRERDREVKLNAQHDIAQQRTIRAESIRRRMG